MSEDFEVLEEEEYKSLEPEAKERYVSNTLNDLVHEHPDGLTKSDIQDLTPFGRKTIDKHLEKLVALNEAYVRRMGGTDVYYPNGRLLRPSTKVQKEIDGKTFRLTLLENVKGESIYVQEIKSDKFGEEVKGGLMVPRDDFEEFVEWLKNYEEEVEE